MDLGSNSNIKDLCNLKFFSDSGLEIYAEKQYVITWELITDNKALYQVPSGYILGDIEKAFHVSRKTGEILYEYYRLRPDTLVIGYTKEPKVIIPPTNNGINPNGIDDTPDNRALIIERIQQALVVTLKGKYTEVKITIHTLEQDYSLTIDTRLFFNLVGIDSYDRTNIYIGSNDDIVDESNNTEYTCVYTVTDIPLQTILEQKDTNGNLIQFGTWDQIKAPDYTEFSETRIAYPYLYYILEPEERGILLPKESTEISKDELYGNNAYIDPYENRKFTSKVQGIAKLFPFVRYNGSFMQEKTSVGLIASNTIIVLEECKASNNEIYYERPALGGDAGWLLSFECPENGELKLIELSTDNDINQINAQSFTLAKFDEDNTSIIEPITIAIGVAAEEEGCYQNFLGIYIRYQNELDIPFFMGMITIKTEMIGEDERYRTLLSNFGIPDPINYTKVFYNTEFSESLPDYQVINEKSKELMLTYTEIFPYAGTYKALINALQFLGYTDIIIKEWYKFFDTNGRERDVAFDAVDIQQNKLADLMYKTYNLDIKENQDINLSKLNWLSLVYHINETSTDNGGIEAIDAWVVNNETGQIISDKKLYFDTFTTTPIYAYRTTEITAKLFYLKKWLEAYIIGLNARIIDITGEGIFYAPMKTLIYSTGSKVLNFELIEHATPKVVETTPFIDSSALITCTLAELKNIRFCDLDNKTYNYYIQDNIHQNIHGVDININISNAVETPVYGDEYQFDLTVTPESGTLYEAGIYDEANSIIVKNNNLDFLNSNSTEVSFENNLPIISIEYGNVRKLIGKWENNVEWLILETTDAFTGKTAYMLKNIGTYAGYPDEIMNQSHVILMPSYTDGNIPELKYTTDNKWRAPMLLIKGYKFLIDFNKHNTVHQSYFDIPVNEWFIIEINRGRLIFQSSEDFKEIDPETEEEIVKYSIDLGTEIKFFPTYDDQYNSEYYQTILAEYTYTSTRESFRTLDLESINAKISEITLPDNLTKDITDDEVMRYALQCANYHTTDLYSNAFLNKDNTMPYYRALLENKRKCDIKNYVNEQVSTIYQKYYTPNRTITVPVHHLGDYTVTVKMYDRYNNIYTNSKQDLAHLTCRPIDFTIYMNQDYSNNEPDFCKTNMKGIDELSVSYKKKDENGNDVPVDIPGSVKVYEMLKNDWDSIKFPNTYDIYDIQNHTNDRNHLYYYNYTYAMDTPKIGDTLVLSNHAIEIKEITYDKERDVTLIDVYDMDTKNSRLLMEGQDIMLGVYDKSNILQIGTYGPYTISEKENYLTINHVDKELSSIDDLTNEDIWRTDFESKYKGKGNIIVHVRNSETNLDLFYRLLNNDGNVNMPYVLMSNWELVNPLKDKEGRIMISGQVDKTVFNNKYHVYIINTTEYELSLDNIYMSDDTGTYNEFIIPGETGILHFEINDVIKVNYMCNEINYDLINFSYESGSVLHNALCDPLFPVVYIKYDSDIYPEQVIQYHKYTSNKDNIRNIDHALEHIGYIETILLIEYAYTDDKPLTSKDYVDGIWTITDLKEYISNQGDNILSYENLIKPLFDNNEIDNVRRSKDVSFNRNTCTVKFAEETINNALYNSVAYRITDIKKDTKFVRNKGNLTEYRYILNMPLDVWFMLKYSNDYIYNLSVKVMYPYTEQVHYHTQVTSNGDENLVNFGTYNYSLIETSFEYDSDNMFLDDYIDNNFIGRIYKYDPNSLRNIAIKADDPECILTRTNAIIYSYKEQAVTIPENRVIMLSANPDNQFIINDLTVYEWEWVHTVFNSPDDIEYDMDDRFRKETLFICNNKTLCIRPNTLGPNDIALSVTDCYGNILLNNSTGRIYIKKVI